jgi:hypothetical protein
VNSRLLFFFSLRRIIVFSRRVYKWPASRTSYVKIINFDTEKQSQLTSNKTKIKILGKNVNIGYFREKSLRYKNKESYRYCFLFLVFFPINSCVVYCV